MWWNCDADFEILSSNERNLGAKFRLLNKPVVLLKRRMFSSFPDSVNDRRFVVQFHAKYIGANFFMSRQMAPVRHFWKNLKIGRFSPRNAGNVAYILEKERR